MSYSIKMRLTARDGQTFYHLKIADNFFFNLLNGLAEMYRKGKPWAVRKCKSIPVKLCLLNKYKDKGENN